MNNKVLSWVIISQGLRYFLESFLEGWTVLKNWAFTKTLLPILKLGIENHCILMKF